jgi:uncharacterized Ntn-hydrolase superfamily protein
VCVAGATCLQLTNLKSLIAVVRVEKGAAAAQANGDVFVQNRPIIRRGLRLGTPPWKILGELENTDNQHETRQYGIVDLTHPPGITFTGQAANPAKLGVVGRVGELRYSIQGNLLTGQQVVLAAESALVAAEGDLAERVMAGMAAARALGGDGRCSCGPSPQACGVPPPDFTSAALSSFLVIARPGDTDQSFAGGDYWCDIKGNSTPEAPLDAVQELELAYAAWRAGLVGVPDQVRTRVEPEASVLPANGTAATKVVVTLVDVDGNELAHGGHRLVVTPRDGVAGTCALGPIEDRGDGTYAFTVRAGTAAGAATWELEVQGGERPVPLRPYLGLKLVGAARPGVGSGR